MEQITQSKVVAFGDSFMWGQGIKHKNKFTTLISKQLFNLEFTLADNHAHSGATILTKNETHPDQPPNIEIPVYGEIPRSGPSITRQIEKYGLNVPTNAKVNPKASTLTFPEMELVFLNGGINDIDAKKINLGKIKTTELSRLTTLYCETHFFTLLEKARKKFPNAQLLVVGYHFVFSAASLKNTVGRLTLTEEIDLIADLRMGTTSNHYFMTLSNAAFQRAVDRFNRVELPQGNKGAFFIPTLHSETHATFAPQSLNWQIAKLDRFIFLRAITAYFTNNWTLGSDGVKPQDEVQSERRAMADIYHNNDASQKHAQSHLASLYHPNSKSAKRVTRIAASTFSQFHGDISVRSLLKGNLIGVSEIMQQLGHPSGTTLRQVYATNTITSIQLTGTVKKGSSGDFPYPKLKIKMDTRNKSFSFRLNESLAGTKGFSDGNDNVYSTPKVKIRSNGKGLVTNSSVLRDTPFNFCAFPDEIISLDTVKNVYIIVDKLVNLKKSVINIENLRLTINGRNFPLKIDRGSLHGAKEKLFETRIYFR